LKVAFAIFATAWSFICMAHGLAGNWQTLFGLRMLLGFAEGSANPAGMKATSEWFPATERGLAGGVFNMGASLGSALAAPLVAWAILTHSWQFAFVLAGLIGLAWVGVWLVCYQPPSTHPALSPAERDYILAGQESYLAGEGRPSLLTVARQRNFWGIAIPRFLADPTWGTLTLWLPLYLTTVRGFDLKQIAMFAWLPLLAADLGCLFGGAISMTLQKRMGLRLLDARRAAFTVGALMMTGVAFAGTVQNAYLAVALLSLAGFAHQTLSVTVITMASDLFKRSEVATVAGMAGTCGNAGVLIFSLLMGALVSQVGYTPFFIGLAALDLLGAVILWTVVRDRRRAAIPVAA
jgi:ACS family hexuronate transporter-like MFS transporter